MLTTEKIHFFFVLYLFLFFVCGRERLTGLYVYDICVFQNSMNFNVYFHNHKLLKPIVKSIFSLVTDKLVLTKLKLYLPRALTEIIKESVMLHAVPKRAP